MANDLWTDYRLLQQTAPEEFTCRIPEGLFGPEIDAWANGLGLGVLEKHFDWLWVREWDGTKAVERPVYLNPTLEERIEGYFRLARNRPDLFTPSGHCPILMDRYAMLSFTERTQKPVGLVFDNSPYYMVVSDLCGGVDRLYAYSRILYPDAQGNGTVIIPRLLRNGQPPLFGILHVFRHSIRMMSGGEFPRGFQAPGITPLENSAKELWEEFRISADRLSALTLLGHSRPDTGLSGGQVQIYLADVSGAPSQANIGHEGITESEWLTEEELLDRIRTGVILDGMTQTAMLLFQLYQHEHGRHGRIS